MSVTQYVGARYVPLFAEPIEWDISKQYEPLTIVSYQGNSYTSKQSVPANIPITNEQFWALTGNYNAQVEQYRREVAGFDSRLEAVSDNIAAYSEELATEIEARKEADSSIDAAYKAADTAIEEGYKAANAEINEKIKNLQDDIAENLQDDIANITKFATIPERLERAQASARIETPLLNNKTTHLQGGTRVNGYDIITYPDPNAGSNGLVIVYNGDTEISRKTLPIKHGNCINYYNGVLYIAATTDNTFIEVSYNKSTNTIGNVLSTKAIPGHSNVNGVVRNDNGYYAYCDNECVLLYSEDATNWKQIFQLPANDRIGVNQTISPYGNDIIICRSTPNEVFFIGTEEIIGTTNNAKCYQKMTLNEQYGLCYFNEPEQVQIDNETQDIIIYAATNLAANANGVYLGLVTVFESNLIAPFGLGYINSLLAGGSIFINLDYSNNNYKIPVFPTGSLPTVQSKAIKIKYAVDIIAIYAAFGARHSIRLDVASDYPDCIFIENMDIRVTANNHVIESVFQRGGKSYFTSMTPTYNAGNNTTIRKNAIASLFNVYSGIVYLWTGAGSNALSNLGTFNSCAVFSQTNMQSHLTLNSSFFNGDPVA